MKKLILITALGALSLTCSAQVERLVMMKGKNSSAASGAAIDSIKKVLPEPVGRVLLPVMYNNQTPWNFYFTPAKEDNDLEFYEVHLKGKTGKQTLGFDKNGNLLQVKQVLKNPEVPAAVINSLNDKYSDWMVVKTEERNYVSDSKARADYKVVLKKGILKKAVLIDPLGEIKAAIPTV